MMARAAAAVARCTSNISRGTGRNMLAIARPNLEPTRVLHLQPNSFQLGGVRERC